MYCERSFAVRDGDAILRGTFDRLVVHHDGDFAVGADVLDYKTDDVPGDDPRAIDARVEGQPAPGGSRAVIRLAGLEPAAVSARLLFVAGNYPVNLRAVGWDQIRAPRPCRERGPTIVGINIGSGVVKSRKCLREQRLATSLSVYLNLLESIKRLELPSCRHRDGIFKN